MLKRLLILNTRQTGVGLKMKAYIANLSETEDILAEWNESIWMLLVDSATVHRDKSITFKFNNGHNQVIR